MWIAVPSPGELLVLTLAGQLTLQTTPKSLPGLEQPAGGLVVVDVLPPLLPPLPLLLLLLLRLLLLLDEQPAIRIEQVSAITRARARWLMIMVYSGVERQ